MNLAQIEEESDKRTEIKLSKALEAETRDFDARTNKSVEVMPYEDEEMIFRQQGRRVSWGRKNARYVAARYYPNADCAREIIDELVRRGCKNVVKEEGQIELF